MHPRQKQVVWTPELAYAVGLITTDGSLSKDGRHFDFTSNDESLIRTFQECLGINNKIAQKRSGFTGKLSSLHIQFGNVTLYRWLIKIGLMPNKSKRLRALTIPDTLFFDFLRGHLDGDGTIKKYQDPVYPKNQRLYISFMSASLAHLLWIKETIWRLTERSGFIRNSNGAYTLTFSKHNSIALVQLLYHQPLLPRLDRKYKIVEEFVLTPR